MSIRTKILEYAYRALAKEHKNLAESSVSSALLAYRNLRQLLGRSRHPLAARLYLRAEDLRRSASDWRHTFVTMDELMGWASDWASELPGSYDLVIGIPRSGLLVANIIAIKMGKPLSTPELFLRGECWMGGGIKPPADFRKILLVDDSVSSGKSMEDAAAAVRSRAPGARLTRAALIAGENSAGRVDLSFKTIAAPRLFEWNMLHTKRGVLVCDLDGVICENCPPGFDADEAAYAAWIRTARPYLIPAFRVDYILSARLERYRPETEAWLAAHGVNYGELLLWDVKEKKDRNGFYSKYKIAALLKIKPDMVWESNSGQARDIWDATKIPTLCTDTKVLYG